MNDADINATAPNGELRRSLNDVIHAAEALMHATVDQTGSEYRKARAALSAKVSAAKEHVAEDLQDAVAGVKALGDKGEHFVQANPWAAIGVGQNWIIRS